MTLRPRENRRRQRTRSMSRQTASSVERIPARLSLHDYLAHGEFHGTRPHRYYRTPATRELVRTIPRARRGRVWLAGTRSWLKPRRALAIVIIASPGSPATPAPVPPGSSPSLAPEVTRWSSTTHGSIATGTSPVESIVPVGCPGRGRRQAGAHLPARSRGQLDVHLEVRFVYEPAA